MSLSARWRVRGWRSLCRAKVFGRDPVAVREMLGWISGFEGLRSRLAAQTGGPLFDSPSWTRPTLEVMCKYDRGLPFA